MSWGRVRALQPTVFSLIALSSVSLAFFLGLDRHWQTAKPLTIDDPIEPISPDIQEENSPPETEPIGLTPLSSSAIESPSVNRDRWSVILPPVSVLITQHDRLMAGSFQPQESMVAATILDDLPAHEPPNLQESGELSQVLAKSRIDYLESDRVKSMTQPIELPAIAPEIPMPRQIAQSNAQQIKQQSSPTPTLNPDRTPNTPEPFQPSQVPLAANAQPSATASPTAAISIPSAYGQTWGKIGIGIGLQSRTRNTRKADGGLGIGIGLGQPQTGVGVDVGVNILDLLGNTAEDGSISIKVHRQLPDNWAIAAGVNNILEWGNTDGGSSVYGVVSKRFDLREEASSPFSRLYTSVGVGGGQFRSETDVLEGNDSVGVFGGVAVRVNGRMNAIAEWTGQDLTLGVSVVPFPQHPLILNPAVTDVTGNAGDGPRFILGIGYIIAF
ncbi:hypothetical protein [Roseofilum casamattae]|uniref:Porin family protein n=1 Tax=Roseofilum casamattae BLCC-M143 TaxID=3022442 RepID=A0ABT7C2I6_9CYAN|nr:hypothetical protein [Roseofilum casamattae]MDJ1185673.1 hypothetical protein [Roseofilum casamattae BLCC-M143]